MEPLLRIEELEKYYGTKTLITKALDNVSFSVSKGEFLGIMGASGSGKTTLLNCISTIDTVTAGHIYLNDTDITELREDKLALFRQENLGFVFQDFNLLDTLTIEENIALAPVIQGISPQKIADEVKKTARQLGILDILPKFPYEVSGGQRQRCACARALISRPSLILADEPTGALDSKSAGMLLECFTQMNHEMQATILMVTHDIFSASYCSRILFLRDGKIFSELVRGNKARRVFFNEILDVVTLLGGDVSDAH
ncbi:ABC transporter ATP-binding protein [Faecalicatena orotica]|uniref:Putative ABC transport system ATP-binding protein n=1 Tax=Faecalicatena orotica TaxID=1544 RepID=A0A2Y9BG47_9FIRM|nr:ABC transporter ATP-binding protein [Faecalicatena orotica]PWJ28646.1 putative ABC transport system ATP-binding protein [Faecalicatena orotica]SSA56468.1 putative ABC transport system ATP-binding protein [Faecalicatena orotica]